MVQGRVQLPRVPHILYVPHVHTVVIVHTGQVLGGGVKGQGQHVRIVGRRVDGRQAAVGKQAWLKFEFGDDRERTRERERESLLGNEEVFTPVLCALGEVDAQPVGSRQCGDVLQVGWPEHSDNTVSTAAENQIVSYHQATSRRCLRGKEFKITPPKKGQKAESQNHTAVHLERGI